MHSRYRLAGALIGLLLAGCAHPPIADVHLHWKANQKEVITADQAVNILDAQNVALAVVTGTPPELALELADADPQRIVPIYGIYQSHGDWSRWHLDDNLITRTRQALGSGRYHGIGEVHMIGGFISDWRKPTIVDLFLLAAEYDVPVLLHTEFSRADYLLGLCQTHPDTRILWAHAGSVLEPDEVRRVLKACDNVHAELAARDPWRHLRHPIADQHGRLLPAWRELVLDYSDRFMIGSDPVWPVDRLNPWDEADTGWFELPRFIAFHLKWLEDLPKPQADAIRWHNARRFFHR